MRGSLAYMTSPGQLELRSYEVPRPEKGALVMRVTRANVCGSELHIWNGRHPQKKKGGLGHEMVGVVEELGEGRTTDSAGQPLAVGDRIAAPYFITCERCRHCLQGEWNLCDNAYDYYIKDPDLWPHFFTSFATHFYVSPRHYVFKVPEEIPESIAASANCALSQVIFGLERLPHGPGSHVLVQGAGGLGLFAAAVLADRGVRVTSVDGVADRLDLARRFGASNTLNIAEVPDADDRLRWLMEQTDSLGVDACVELTGVPAAFSEGLSYLRRGGSYLVMGNLSPGVEVDYDPGWATRRAITIHHVDRYEPRYLKKAIDFLQRTVGRLPYESITDAPFRLTETENALAQSASRRITRASIIP